MRLSINGFFSVFLLGVIGVSCERVRPNPPEATLLDSTLAVPVSTINIPITYEVAKLEEMVNTKVKGVFVREQFRVNEKDDSLFIEVEKNGPILLSWRKQTLYYSVPVHVSGKFIKHIAGIKIRNAQPVEMELILHFATTLAIDKRWNLNPESRLDEIKWIKDPTLKIGIVKVNLKKLIAEALEKQKDKLIPKMDDAIGSLLSTRKVILKLWQDIQKPIRINKKGTEVWLKSYATDISARLTDSGPDKILLDVQLKSQVRTLIGDEAGPPVNDTLPVYHKKERGEDSLRIYVLATIPFDRANTLLNEELKGKKITAEGYSTTIRSLELYGTKKGIAIKLKVRGDIDGQVYAMTEPGYDTANAKLYAAKFAFDVDTENALVNSADWIMHEHALDMITQKMQLDVQPFMNQLPGLIMRAIEKGNMGEKMDLTISTLAITPQQSLITKDAFQIIFLATGKAEIGLEQKVFAKKKNKKK